LQTLILGNWSPPGTAVVQHFDDTTVAELAPLGGSLQTLMLSSYMGTLSAACLARALAQLTQLRAVELHVMMLVGDAGLGVLASAPFAPQLAQLSLTKTSGHLSPSGMLRALPRFQALRHLALRSCDRAVTDDVIACIAAHLPMLDTLHIANAPCSAAAGVFTLLSRLRRLQTLELSFCTPAPPPPLSLGVLAATTAAAGSGSGGGGTWITNTDSSDTGDSSSRSGEAFSSGGGNGGSGSGVPRSRSGNNRQDVAASLLSPSLPESPSPHLHFRTLSLSCSDIGRVALELLPTYAPLVTCVDLAQCTAVDDQAISMLPDLPHLTSE
jgi:uncharacterized membrane protein YgcG